MVQTAFSMQQRDKHLRGEIGKSMRKSSNQTRKEHVERVKRLSRIALLSAVALVLSFVETMIPLPIAFPGFKLGLANVAVLVALYATDARSAACVAAVKVAAAGFLFGSPTMLVYSASGTLLAFLGMWIFSRVNWLDVVPVSMIASLLHVAGQLCAAAAFLASPAVLINALPLGVAACVTGFLTGMVARGVLNNFAVQNKTERMPIDLSNLDISPGQLVAFVGRNGSGKTAAALQLAGLLEQEDGSFYLASGNALAGIPKDAEKSAPESAQAACDLSTARAGIAFQDPDDQIVALLVADDVAFGPENRGVSRQEMQDIVCASLKRVGLAGLERRPVGQLSGGQKQRVAAAGLLACSFPMLVFDETSAMLDRQARADLMSAFRELCRQGVAVVIVTQLMEEAFQADKIVVFSEGALVAQGAPSELEKQESAFLSWGLELPKRRQPVRGITPQQAYVAGSAASASLRVPAQATREETMREKAVPLLSCEKLFLSYEAEGAVRRKAPRLGQSAGSAANAYVLSDFDFSLYPGQVVALTGRSGCGKTTLLRALAGELAPARGAIFVSGENYWSDKRTVSPDERRFLFAQNVGMCPQMPERALFAKTAFEDVAFGARNKGMTGAQLESAVCDALELLHLGPERARAHASCSYSGGEQRRIALASVFACQPKVLLLDEPTAGLDPVERESLMTALMEFAAAGGAVLFSTHDEALARRSALHVVCLDEPAAGASEGAASNSAVSGQVTQPCSERPSNPLPFGVFRESNSFAHRLHPATKIVFCLFLMVGGFCLSGPVGMSALVLASLTALFAAQVSMRQIGAIIRPFLPLLVFVAVFNLLFSEQFLCVSVASFALAVENLLRFICVLLGSSTLMYTTSPTALSDGVYLLASPFSRRRGKVDDAACALGLTFRFTTVLVDEFYQVRNAQQAKMARFDGPLVQRLRALVPVLTVLFVRALRRSDTLALSLINRGYGIGQKRSCYRVYCSGWRDAIALVLGASLVVLAVVL